MLMGCIRRCLSEIHIAFLKSRRNLGVIREISPYLEKGFYQNSLSFDRIHRIGEKTRMKVKTFSSYGELYPFSACLIKLYNSITAYFVRNSYKDFMGTDVIISSSLTEYKVFDYCTDRVLTYFKSEKKMDRIIRDKKLFIDVFRVPRTLTINYKNSFIIEEMISHHDFDVRQAFEELCSDISKFILYNSTYLERDPNYHNKCKFFSDRFGQSELLIESIGSLMTLTHGDLWSSNCIFDGEQFYITDFERVGKRYFLFDFFLFIFTEWHLNGNAALIDNYFNGRYDRYLDLVFKGCSLTYENESRQSYFLAFLVSITYERWQTNREIDKKIRKFIQSFIPSYS